MAGEDGLGAVRVLSVLPFQRYINFVFGSSGKGLGKNEQGITDFIRAAKKDDNAGVR